MAHHSDATYLLITILLFMTEVTPMSKHEYKVVENHDHPQHKGTWHIK